VSPVSRVEEIMLYRAIRLVGLIACAALLFSPTPSQAATTWSSFDYPGAFATFAQAINNSGVIVGGYVLQDGTEQGFVYADGQFTSFSVPGANATVVTGITDTGLMAGYYSDDSFVFHSFIYDGQNYTTIDYPGATAGTTILAQINNAGTAVGNYSSDDGLHHGFTYAGGVFTSVDVPGATGTYAYGINNGGDIAGGYSSNGGTTMHGFILADTKYHGLNFPKAPNTCIRAINDSRQFVGLINSLSDMSAGFSYTGTSFQSMVYPGAYFTVSYGLDNSGDIVGYYIDKKTGSGHAFLQTPN
jgi:probable HAF family extracellular repeat protein